MERRASRVYPVLSRPKRIAGVEDKLALANGVIAIAVANLHQWHLLPAFFLFHFLLRIAGKREPEIRKVYRRYAGQADLYEPFPRDMGSKTRNARPEELGRGVPC